MKFGTGDKVRVTRDWVLTKKGMVGEVVRPESGISVPLVRFSGWTDGHDGRSFLGSYSPLPEGSTEGHFVPEEHLEFAEKSAEQKKQMSAPITKVVETTFKCGDFSIEYRSGDNDIWLYISPKCAGTTETIPLSLAQAENLHRFLGTFLEELSRAKESK